MRKAIISFSVIAIMVLFDSQIQAQTIGIAVNLKTGNKASEQGKSSSEVEGRLERIKGDAKWNEYKKVVAGADKCVMIVVGDNNPRPEYGTPKA